MSLKNFQSRLRDRLDLCARILGRVFDTFLQRVLRREGLTHLHISRRILQCTVTAQRCRGLCITGDSCNP